MFSTLKDPVLLFLRGLFVLDEIFSESLTGQETYTALVFALNANLLDSRTMLPAAALGDVVGLSAAATPRGLFVLVGIAECHGSG